MRILMLGPPGSGKGTQAQMVAAKYGLVYLSTGDMLRSICKQDNELARNIKQQMDGGNLVADEYMIAMVQDRVAQPDCDAGVLLDGFPRTVVQALALQESGFELTHVILLDVSDEEIIKRMAGRRVHPASGRVYHLEYNPPQVAGRDDESGEELVLRPDDRPEVVRARLAVYSEHTLPLVDYFIENFPANFSKVDGVGAIRDVAGRLNIVLDTDL